MGAVVMGVFILISLILSIISITKSYAAEKKSSTPDTGNDSGDSLLFKRTMEFGILNPNETQFSMDKNPAKTSTKLIMGINAKSSSNLSALSSKAHTVEIYDFYKKESTFFTILGENIESTIATYEIKYLSGFDGNHQNDNKYLLSFILS